MVRVLPPQAERHVMISNEVLVEHSQPAAYCVAGRQPMLILTAGAVQALDTGQLDAVLAHERAHLTGRHHRLVAMARIGREVLPFLPLMQDAVNSLAAGPVLPGMRIHRRNDLPETPAGRADHTMDAPARRLRWRARRRQDRGNARQAPASDTGADQTAQVRAAPGETMAAAMPLAIALLTAGLDSPDLEAWAADTLTPVDTDGLGDFMAGLHVISVVLLHELHEATGEPSVAILQRLAIMAERRRGTPLAD